MTRDAKTIEELDLLAYADGRLDADPVRKAAVEHFLQARPGLRATLAQDRRIVELIRRHHPLPREPLPRPMMDLLQQRRAGPERFRMLLSASAGAAAMAMVLTIAPLRAPQEPGHLQYGAVATHSASGGQSVVLERNGRSVFPDLTPWTVRQVELDTGRGGVAPLRIVYESNGRSLTLSVSAADDSPPIPVPVDATTRTVRWTNGGVAYALTGNISEADFQDVVARLKDDRIPSPQPPVTPLGVENAADTEMVAAAGPVAPSDRSVPSNGLPVGSGALTNSP